MLDLHAHLLPGLDDGPADLSSALDLARAFVAAGTTTVVATPHVSWTHEGNDALRIADAVLLLRRALKAEGIALDVRRGAEVALTRAMDLPAEEVGKLTLAGSPWLLVECPRGSVPSGLEAALGALAGNGLLLAHPERIPAFRQDPALLRRLVVRGARCQLTAGAFTGGFGKEAKRFAEFMVKDGLAHVVASDAHSVDARPPEVRTVLRGTGMDPGLVTWLTRDAPAALLAGERLPPRPWSSAPSRGVLRRRHARVKLAARSA